MYNSDEIAILLLNQLEISYKKMQDLFNFFDSPACIFDAKNRADLLKFLTEKQTSQIAQKTEDEWRKEIETDLERYKQTAVTFLSKDYPACLKNIEDFPFALYLIGNTALLSKPKIGIVGTRKPTSYGRDVTAKFTKELVQAGLATTSGLSYGIDTVAAESTLEAGGEHIAVLAGGLDDIYPAQNIGLAKRIVRSGGLLVSEYPPRVRPKQYTFLARNRIVSGLSDGLLVVEAGQKSGTKSTANFCINQGRELFVVPGNIFSPQSAGTNELINEIPDCFTISTEQILSRLGLTAKTTASGAQSQLDFESQKIIEFLADGDKHFDEIAENLKINANELSSKLVMLELLGLIHKEAGNFYSLAH